MHTVAIGDMGEYGFRLTCFLERHLCKDVRIIRCSDSSQYAQQVPRDACCLGTAEQLMELGEDYGRKIVIAREPVAGGFCMFHSPVELVNMIEGMLQQETMSREVAHGQVTITAVFMPVFDAESREILLSFMEAGDLCLGMEDAGGMEEEKGDMGDLCYYIHLRQENLCREILERRQELEGRYFVDSPQSYFDLMELTQEDYQWFFEQLRSGKAGENIFITLGNGVAGNLNLFPYFDRIIALYPQENRRMQTFCRGFGEMLKAKEIHPRGGVDIIAKETLFG